MTTKTMPNAINNLNKVLRLSVSQFKPPKSRDNWVNIECMEERRDRIIHKSTYHTVPASWLGQIFIDEAEYLKATKPQAYEHEYNGVATGTGGTVFENIEAREITDSELATFDHLFFGLDFGFAVDPLAWGKFHYDKKNRKLYILDEIYEPKLKNSIASEKIKQKHPGSMLITADCAEAKSINEMKYDHGLNIAPAKKGPDSIEHGIKWLQDLDAIVIDKRRTPNAYKEFTLYEYRQNKQGEFISAYPDKNNHFIDCTRYAMESESGSKKKTWYGVSQ